MTRRVRFPSPRALGSVPAVVALLLGLGCAASDPAPPAAPPEQSVKPGINQPYFDNPDVSAWIARFEVESREIWTERDRIIAALGIRPGDAVADVGAGSGFLTRLIAQATGPSGMVYAVDIMKSFLDHIEARARAEGLANLRTVLCTDRSVELPEASVDLVFVCDTYHHFEYPKSTLASIHRALRPGGRLVVVDFIRIPGTSRPWVLDHVRAGEETVSAEIVAAGFERVGEERFLKENYLLRFLRR